VKRMINKLTSNPSRSTNLPSASISKSGGFKRFRKKFYVFITLIVVLIIVVTLLIPQGVAAIPLNVDYVVGEKMIYDSITTAIMQVHNSTLTSMLGQSNNVTSKSTQSIDVVNFDANTTH